METTQRRGDSQREERKAVAHVGHTHRHSHTLIFLTSFCEMVLSKVKHYCLRGAPRAVHQTNQNVKQDNGSGVGCTYTRVFMHMGVLEERLMKNINYQHF